jgi:TolB protein
VRRAEVVENVMTTLKLMTVFALSGWLAAQAPGALAACSGDCNDSGNVTVDEVVLGVGIVLGSAQVTQCPTLDSSGNHIVTIDELIGAVEHALSGCPSGTFAGDYAASVSFDAAYAGIINLTADANRQVSGSLLVTSGVALRAGSAAAGLSFTFPVGGVSVGVSGMYDPDTGGFEVSGTFTDANQQTIQVVISGTLPGPTGSAPVNVYVGSDPPFATTLSAGMLATPTPTPSPTPPPGNGPRIVYASGLPSQISVINVDGSGKTQLTNSAGNSTYPAWSPDGSKIAFSAPYQENRYIGIAVMNADGNDLHVLGSENTFLDYFPAWSPDGTQIVFASAGGDHIDVMNADGSGRHRLVTKAQGEAYGHLSWSPDGTRIAFESTRPRDAGSENRVEIWVMNADGSNFVRLTNNDLPDRHPDWSPNGQTIVFQRGGFSPGIYTIKPDGSGEARLLLDPFGVTAPNWSQDGQQLAYSSLFGFKITNANGANAVTVPNTAPGFNDFDFR